ncbi:MAG: dihydrolipoyl dehydrogenase [Verrucomicrobiae bacterium]|nr:dihydrolipoyl dehydrogenase [Verrucomicrobiae bacterium]
MSEQSKAIHVAVIGAGPGGYPAAFHASDLGMKVTLIDPEAAPGGVCLHRGCIPSKTLLHVAKMLEETKAAAEIGVRFGTPEIDLDQLRGWKRKVVEKLTGGLGQLCKQRQVNHIQGRARFSSPNSLLVQRVDGKEETVPFDFCILATGSRPVSIQEFIIGSRTLNSSSALELPDIPKTMLVVGGGYIGLELGSVYAALGTKVSVVEMTPGLLPGADRDLVLFLAKRLQQRFESILLGTKVTEMKEDRDGVKVKFCATDGKESERVFEKILVSVGRRPNSENLGLENTKVKLTARGFVEVDGQRRTAEPAIFAIGDVAGDPMLAHKATAEARVAVEAIAGQKTVFDPQAIPAVVFTDPEIAWCGLTETQARNGKHEIKAARFPWAASGRATTLQRDDGVTKLIVDPSSERILGMGIAGPGAGELIAEGTLAIEMGATAADLKQIIHPHPTLSETLMESAEVFYGQSPHFMQRRK